MTTLPRDRAAIEARLPHRDPFLFVDRILAVGAEDPPETLRAEWEVPRDAAFFAGHYPGNPVTPGVILCEHAFQAAALLLCERGQSFGAAEDVPVLARIEKAKFRRLVRPGERLETEVRLVDAVGPATFLACRVAVGDETAVELRCVLARAARKEDA